VTATPLGAMRQAFINWAEKHPKNWSLEGADGVMLVLSITVVIFV
jgi:hypothetical protein